MHDHLPPRLRAVNVLTVVSLASLAMLAACSGGSSDAPAAGTATTMSGTVAVGAPITSGKMRVLDATGATVASDVTIDANGRYADIALTGPAPYRIEACGYAGPNYTCVYSVANGAGTVNVTSLTTATVLLAAGADPGSLMTGAAAALTTDSVAAAQVQLRTSLASVLTSAGVNPNIDFVSADLTAGSRAGYDGVLDAVSVNLGKDTTAFVQITPRLGQGNLYLEQGRTTGSVTSSASAASLQLSGLETLFQNMTASLASPAACVASATAIANSLASNVQMSLGEGDAAHGIADVSAGLCGFFGTGDDGSSPIWGYRFLSPTLGRCDLSGAAPICPVSFVLQSPEGDVMPVGSGMAVTKEAGAWKFMGDLVPIQIHASAKAQRTKRIDSATPVYQYDRALAFEVAAVSGLACAKVSQHDADGIATPIAFYKLHPGASHQVRLALWTPDGFQNSASLNPLVGSTRSADDTWVGLPQGDAGDAVIRNFYRGGRSVNIALYSDASCATPFAVSGRDNFDVDVDGVPPVWAAMPNLPWPEVDAATAASLRSLSIDSGSTGSFAAAWTFPNGVLGVKGSTVCGSRATCGESGGGRLGEASTRGGAHSVTVALHDMGVSVAADDDKTFALYGSSGDGIDLQTNFSSCPASADGESCH